MDSNPATPPSRPRRKASLESVSLIKYLASSGSRSKRRSVIGSLAESGATSTFSPISSPLDTPEKSVEKEGQSLAQNLDSTLFPPDLGIDFKVGSKVYAKDGYGKWYLARILEIRYDTGHVLVHFEYWSQKYDEWISASGGRLRAADSDEKPHPGELLQVGDFVFARWADKGGIYPAQIIEAFEKDKFKLLYYDGFEKVTHRRTLKKMSDAEVKELDLVHFGQLKILPTFPNDLFNPDLADKYDGKRRSRATASTTSGESPGVVAAPSASGSPSTPTAATASVDARLSPKKCDPNKTDVVGDLSLAENSDADDVIIEKNALKPLPKRLHAPRRTRKLLQSLSDGQEKSIIGDQEKSIIGDGKKSIIDNRKKSIVGDQEKSINDNRNKSISGSSSNNAKLTPILSDSSPTKSDDAFLIDVKKSSTVDVDDLPLAQTVAQNLAEKDRPTAKYNVMVKGSKMIIRSSNATIGRLRPKRGQFVNRYPKKTESVKQMLVDMAHERTKMKKAAMGVAFAVAKLSSPKISTAPTANEVHKSPDLAKNRAKERFIEPSSCKRSIESIDSESALSLAKMNSEEAAIKKKKQAQNGPATRSQVQAVLALLEKNRGVDCWLLLENDLLFCTPCRLRHQDQKSNRQMSRFICGMRDSFWSIDRIKCHAESRVHKVAVHWMHRLTGRAYQDPFCAMPNDEGNAQIAPVAAKTVQESPSIEKAVKDESVIAPVIFALPKPKEKKWQQTTVTLYRDQWFKKDGDTVYCEACRACSPENADSWKLGTKAAQRDVVSHENSALHKECLRRLYKDQRRAALKHIEYLNHLSHLAEHDSTFLCPDPYCYTQCKAAHDLSSHIQNLHHISATGELPQLIRCVCDSAEKEEIMIQCRFCSTWQHGYCFDIDAEVAPVYYICYVCARPFAVDKSIRLANNSLAAFEKLAILPSLSINNDPACGVDASNEQAKRLNLISREIVKIQTRLAATKLRLKLALHPTSSGDSKKPSDVSSLNEEIEPIHTEVEQQMDRMEYLLDDFAANSRMVSTEKEFEKLTKIAAVDLSSVFQDVKRIVADCD